MKTSTQQKKPFKHISPPDAPKPAPVGRPGRGKGHITVTHYHPYPDLFPEKIALAILEFVKAL